GMVRSFISEFETIMRKLDRRRPASPKQLFGTIMTGTLFAPVLQKKMARLNESFGTRLHVLPVENQYFGGDVSIAGLLTGQDFLAARDRVRGDFAIVPRVTLKSDEPMMLDGMKIEEMKSHFPLPVYALDLRELSQIIVRQI